MTLSAPKPKLVLDQFFRKVEELFTPEDWARLTALCEVVGGQNWPMSPATLEQHRGDMRFLVAARPTLDREQLAAAPALEAIIEVSGRFPETVDYDAAFRRGIRVLSSAPGFRESVAEMCLGLMLAGARGIVAEHEAFRLGHEHWLADNGATDFSLFGARVGFVGYGSIAREVTRLLAPFRPLVAAYDPWLPPGALDGTGVELMALDDLARWSRVLVVAATPTRENAGLVSEPVIRLLPRGTLVVLISRAHLADFPALVAAARERRIRLAVDVFPAEPVPADDPVRGISNVILSPHRAAAVDGGRQLIGRMIVDDIAAMLEGRPPTRLQPANPATIGAAISTYAV